MKDKFLIGVIGGAAGALVMVVLDFVINLIPGINMKLIFGVSEMFVPKTMTGTFQGGLIGFVAHMACGSIVGLGILVALELTGYHYLWSKELFLA